MSKRLAVIGGGSWGTALASVLAPRFDQTRLWIREPEIAKRTQATRINDVFLPAIPIHHAVEIETDASAAANGADIVLMVVPSRYLRAVTASISPGLKPDAILVSATKGIESNTLLRMSQVIGEASGRSRIAVLSGPTFAREVAMGQPAAVAVASSDAALAATIQEAFSGQTLRLYTNPDVVGVEVGAALKNVIAIAAGVCHGLNLGGNAQAALITRGLAEITRLAVAMGGRPQTMAGLAGLGDLVLTCTGDLSRNRKAGMALAAGQTVAEIVASSPMIAEGIETTFAAMDLSQRFGADLPITAQMKAILEGVKSPAEAVRQLMVRSLKEE